MSDLPEERKEIVTNRRLIELVELMNAGNRTVDSESLTGRQSGSLAWRMSRGENDGSGDFKPNVWKLTENEIKNKSFYLEYDVVKDEYLRDGVKVLDSWVKGLKSCSDIFRKEEHDWNMVYLARTGTFLIYFIKGSVHRIKSLIYI